MDYPIRVETKAWNNFASIGSRCLYFMFVAIHLPLSEYSDAWIHIVIPPSLCILESSVIFRVADVSTPLSPLVPLTTQFSLCGKGSGWRGGTEADSGASGWRTEVMGQAEIWQCGRLSVHPPLPPTSPLLTPAALHHTQARASQWLVAHCFATP